MWSLPPEFLAAYYYERHGGGEGGCEHVSGLVIKVEEDRIMSPPSPIHTHTPPTFFLF